MIRDLVKIRCCVVLSGVELPVDTLSLQALRCSLFQGDRSPATRQLLAFKTVLTWILPCCLFLVTSLWRIF